MYVDSWSPEETQRTEEEARGGVSLSAQSYATLLLG
jgi:hypothetical protein